MVKEKCPRGDNSNRQEKKNFRWQISQISNEERKDLAQFKQKNSPTSFQNIKFQRFGNALREARQRVARVKNYESFNEDEGFGEYNSPLADYEDYFQSVLHGKSIVDLLRRGREEGEEKEGTFKEGALVVDLMAPSGTLAELFQQMPPDPKRRGIAVSLADQRTAEEKARDERLGIIQITGDLSRSQTWRELEEAMGGQKADLIMEKASAGFHSLPPDPQFYDYAVRRLWRNLNSEGTMLLQAPFYYPLSSTITSWQYELIENHYDHELVMNMKSHYAYVRLTKHEDSPPELP